ncbi:Thiamine pyrophosphokinase [Candidatus Izimaplasma bacterium HR1]|jgi:thiamine pyrophosphokinase|uniref:thiamine diphosphokinase n=1 Tax=Candidatus Izimoplasma sp. HR1 TaxID=1541959 RepID=UPI0004F595B1|nr:Thiamine pyrophosphokinase [Candidatus Izimaplasma bacterium HR1]
MKCNIVTGPNNYDLKEIFTVDETFTIGADIGAYILSKNEVKFDLALGDFDSVTPYEFEKIKKYAKEIKEYPIKKDRTDTFLAVEEALIRGFDDITIYGGLGRRMDHTIANIMLLKLGDIKIVSENEVMYILDPNTYEINNTYKYISFFALEDVEGLTLHGFEYELNNYSLTVDDPICISNKGKGTVSFKEGLLLVVHQKEQ